VVEVAKLLADLRGVSFDEICRQSTGNFFKLFAKVPRGAASAGEATSARAAAAIRAPHLPRMRHTLWADHERP